jgi:hypothetical protein
MVVEYSTDFIGAIKALLNDLGLHSIWEKIAPQVQQMLNVCDVLTSCFKLDYLDVPCL